MQSNLRLTCGANSATRGHLNYKLGIKFDNGIKIDNGIKLAANLYVREHKQKI